MVRKTIVFCLTATMFFAAQDTSAWAKESAAAQQQPNAASLTEQLMAELARYQEAVQAYRRTEEGKKPSGSSAPAGLTRSEAEKRLGESLKALDNIHAQIVATHGETSPETLLSLYSRARTSTLYISSLQGRKLFKQAEKIIKRNHGKTSLEYAVHFILVAEINHLAGESLSAGKSARKAQKLLKQLDGKDARKYLAKSYYWSAKSLSQRGHVKSAVKEYERYIATLQDPNQPVILDMDDHMKLVTTYMWLDRPEDVVRQSQLVGKLRAEAGYHKPVALYQPRIWVPTDAYKGGHVKYSFTVKADGTTSDIVVLDRKGHPDLEWAGREAIEGSYYAPSYTEQGPVDTEKFELTLYWYAHGRGAVGGSLGPTRVSGGGGGQRSPIF